jgi:transposase
MKTQVSNKIRRIMSDYNADRRDLFSRKGLEYLAQLPLNDTDRYIVDDLLAQRADLDARLAKCKLRLLAFAKKGSQNEQRQRELLRSVPGVGPITTEIVLAELGDLQRFRSAKQVVAYSGLAPGRRESAGKARDLGITKDGPPLLRWILVEAGWQTIRRSHHWREIYQRIGKRRGARRAIVAVARRLLEVMIALLRDNIPYEEQGEDPPKPTRKVVLRPA